jgi:hypothetical protein
MPGAVRARFTAGVWLSASRVPRKPSAATGNHGTPWPICVRYQPCCAITALAVNQPPSPMAAAAASSAARARPRPERAAGKGVVASPDTWASGRCCAVIATRRV